MAEDPGWIPAIGNFWRLLVFPTFFMRTKRGKSTSVLVLMRSLTVAAPVTWLILLNALLYLHKAERPHNATVVALIVVGDGLLNLAIFARLRTRVLAGVRDTTELASKYRAVFFVGWAMANGVVMFGFVGFFITSRLTIYAIAIPFALVGIFLAAPTRSRIDRDQIRLRAEHSQLALLDALMLPNGDIPQRPGKR